MLVAVATTAKCVKMCAVEPTGIAEQGFMIFGTKCDNAVLGKKQNTTTDTVGEALVSAKNGTKTSYLFVNGR